MNVAYLFCFDIDGTLRDNKYHEVSDSTLKALHLLKEKGYKLVVSSGRGYDSLKRTNIMGLIPWDGFVLNNGQLILDGDYHVLSEAHLSDKAIRETLRIAKELNMCVSVKSQPRFISKEPDDYVRTSIAYFNSVIPEVGEYTEINVAHKDTVVAAYYVPGYTKSYQWFKCDSKPTGEIDDYSGTPIDGATSETLEIPIDTVGTFYYFCKVTAFRLIFVIQCCELRIQFSFGINLFKLKGFCSCT